MEDLRFNEIENRTQAWRWDPQILPIKLPFGSLQDFSNLIITMKEYGITVDEFVEFVEDKKRRIIAAQEEQNRINEIHNKMWTEKAPKCPDCGKPLTLGKIGENPKGYKSQFFCEGDVSDECVYTGELKYEETEEILQQLVINQ